MKKVIVIVGPTASGKTRLSIELAKHFNAEIINGDSVQVYKELNIGSAKIKEEEKAGIPHHLFDILNVGKSYSAYNFQKDARRLINEIAIPIIVGGTGFYIKSALYNYEFREDDNYNYKDYDNLTNKDLYEELKLNDPNLEIDINNRVRLVRAYHLSKTNHKRSEKVNKDEPLYNILTIYLDVDRKVLKPILIKRLDEMINAGFIDEVKSIRNKNIELNIIGYRELNQYLANEISLEVAKDEIIKSSMRLAKRQKTWFLNQMNSKVFDAYKKDLHLEIIEVVKEFLNE
ncbi:MAG TPA: tRNA (adenosine(37)-N6)-dimethylallyltransferase MiaA [Acholeplasma sp.]|nr:tRNA (adenosine(37)-N6)-dimethylallyltransferase MiaA [Acholeplasma sp.]